MMINVNGDRKRPLGEVLNFPITIKGITIPIDVVVVDANSYSAIVGNDWLSRVRARLDYESCIMIMTWEDKEIEVPIEYRCMPHEKPEVKALPPEKEVEEAIEEIEEVSEEEDEEYEEEFEEEELEEKVFCHFQLEPMEEESQDLTDDESIELTCQLDGVVTNGLRTIEDIVLVDSSVYLDKQFHYWNYFHNLEKKFMQKPPKKAKWEYD